MPGMPVCLCILINMNGGTTCIVMMPRSAANKFALDTSVNTTPSANSANDQHYLPTHIIYCMDSGYRCCSTQDECRTRRRRRSNISGAHYTHRVPGALGLSVGDGGGRPGMCGGQRRQREHLPARVHNGQPLYGRCGRGRWQGRLLRAGRACICIRPLVPQLPALFVHSARTANLLTDCKVTEDCQRTSEPRVAPMGVYTETTTRTVIIT